MSKSAFPPCNRLQGANTPDVTLPLPPSACAIVLLTPCETLAPVPSAQHTSNEQSCMCCDVYITVAVCGLQRQLHLNTMLHMACCIQCGACRCKYILIHICMGCRHTLQRGACRDKFWAGIRATCEPLFHSRMLRAHGPLINEAASGLVRHLHQSHTAGSVQINNALAGLTMEVIGGAAFG